MTTSDPEQPSRLRSIRRWRTRERSADPNAPVDYPTDAGLPPPVYPPPYPGAAGYPGYPAAPGYYPGAYDPYRPTKPPGTNGMAIAALVTLVVRPDLLLRPAVVSSALILGIIGMRETKRTGQDGLRDRVDRHHHRRTRTSPAGCSTCCCSIGIYASGWQWAP